MGQKVAQQFKPTSLSWLCRTMMKFMHFYRWCTAAIMLTSKPQTSGTYCPGPVTFTCVVTQINALLWLVNSSTLTTYTHKFPLPRNFPLDGVMAEIINASFNSPPSFDVTSVLNVNDVSVLNGTSLQCATSFSQSDSFHIEVNDLSKLNVQLL